MKFFGAFFSTAFFSTVAATLVVGFSLEAAASRGIELYTWKDADGNVAYSLMNATSHPRQLPDIVKSKTTSLKALEARLLNLREGTQVHWNDMVATTVTGTDKAKFVLPDASSYNRIRATAARAHLKVVIAQ